jgi:hypothetical protein
LEGFKKLPILLNLKTLVGGGIINNLSNMILNCLLVYGELTMQKVINKFNFLGSNGVAMFIGVYSGVTTQIYKRLLPFMLAIHCVVHWTNLVMQTFSKQPLVQNSRVFYKPHTHIFPFHTKDTLNNVSLHTYWRQRGTN